jgi:hypothetical protein
MYILQKIKISINYLKYVSRETSSLLFVISITNSYIFVNY